MPVTRLSMLKNDAQMFGLGACVRGALSFAIAPKYTRDDFDRRYGTDTSTHMDALEAGIPTQAAGNAMPYEPTPGATIRHIIRNLPIKPSEFTWLDVGCGKGRTLLEASTYPWQGITGIELSSPLVSIAERNIVTYLSRAPQSIQCREITVRCDNATTFALPDANVLLFLFNPFVGAIFKDFLEHVHQEARLRPARHVWLAYVNPWHGDQWLDRHGHFRHVAFHRVIARTWSWSLWQHRG